jgi:hypothetical protein
MSCAIPRICAVYRRGFPGLLYWPDSGGCGLDKRGMFSCLNTLIAYGAFAEALEHCPNNASDER